VACHALLADDDPLLREIAGEYLRGVGFVVTLAQDGLEALDAVAAWRFDVIITDMVMPNLDGIELIAQLKTCAPDTPVLAISAGMSGTSPELVLRAAKAVGAAEVMAKPLSRTKFLATVGTLLGAAASCGR
jgi:CheY-like chemotaxis protein